MNEMNEKWEVVGQEAPGYFGARRDAIFAEWDQAYGVGNWKLGWLGLSGEIVDFLGACELYELSYLKFLSAHPLMLEQLLVGASDVYDDAPSNVGSGLDYSVQETERTHIQDIAIRNVVAKLGKTFRGTELVQIRSKLGKSPLSMALSPGQVPFLVPEGISTPANAHVIRAKSWWTWGSVEDFYQLNKRLLVRS